MGIPGYFKTVTRKYANILIEQNRPGCARLFLDLNCAIHQCANGILQSNQNILPEKLEVEIVKHTIDYIHKITEYVEPSELLFIGIDGIPPRSKISQQRKRRFVSAWRSNLINAKKKETNTPYTAFDSNTITPGTAFMDYLSKSLHDHFIKDKPFPYQVMLSDSNESGEGEAKIMEYIKHTPVPKDNGKDIIYGLDADLIMLSMLKTKNNIYLLREPTHYDMKVPKPFLYLNIPLLRKYIAIECSQKVNEGEQLNNDEYNVNLVWDYVVVCFLQGNDFLPPLSFLKIVNNGIDTALHAYVQVREETKQYLTMFSEEDGKYHMNYVFFLKMLEKLKNIEDVSMCEAEDAYYSRNPLQYLGRRVGAEKIAFEIDNYPALNKFPPKIQPQRSGWRLNYYYHLFDMTDIQDINNVCLNYLQGIEWTFQYYFNGCMSDDWHYVHYYSPTLLDLYNFLVSHLDDTEDYLQKSIHSSFPKVTYDTDLQLLMCLPCASRHLLKPELRRIMTDISLGCTHYYPERFQLTSYLHNFLWECSAKLPQIDVHKLNEVKQTLLTK